MPRKPALPSKPVSAPRFEPALEGYCEILRDYSLNGLGYFNSLRSEIRTKVSRRLRVQIEDDEWAIRDKFKKAAAQSAQVSFGLLPMPKPGDDNLELAFFIPRFRRGPASSFSCSFCLLLWRNVVQTSVGRAMAFRFEVSDPGAHSYPHIQMSRIVRDPVCKTDWPDWSPDSYPAFPLAAESPIAMFLSLITAMHGYDPADTTKYVQAAIRDSMRQASSAARADKLVAELSYLWPKAA